MKKFLNIILIFIIFITTVSVSISYFISQETTIENYISIGSIFKQDISIYTYIAEGPSLTFGGEISNPYRKYFDLTRRLSDYPYFNWANDKKNNIMDAILNNNGIIPQQNTYFAKSKDINYLKNNPVYFDTSTYSLFFRDRQLHQFFVIYNNAHLLKKGRKMNFRNEKDLNVQANVVFQGTTSNKIWNTNYNSKFDLYDRRYYATNTYYYDRDSKTFKECARGTWRFYNYADLIIVDLGTTGYIQDNPKNWTSGIRQPLNHLLTLDMKKTNDTKAKVIKAHYNITFSPSWNSKKVLEKSIYLN